MTYSNLGIPFQRVTYRDGQRLTAQDLRDHLRRELRLQWLHTQHLHDTWGITIGLQVVLPDKKRTQVVVKPGHALDSWGRDLLLSDGAVVSVPATAGVEQLVLTVRYQEDAAYRQRLKLAGQCLGGGLDIQREQLLFAWRQPEDVLPGPEVPLVQVTAGNSLVQGSLDLRVRRYARTLSRPRVAWGETEPGRSGWTEWLRAENEPIGLQLLVDTSEAGFSRTPYYFARLRGQFGFTEIHTELTGAASAFFLSPFSFVARAAPEGFTFQVFQADQGRIPPQEAERRQWTISWLAVEAVPGCGPALNLSRLFTLAGMSMRGAALFNLSA